MKFICSHCKQTVNSTETKRKIESNDFECLNCRAVIATDRYTKDPHTTTVFYPLGTGFGDLCVGLNVVQFYASRNLDEKIILLNDELPVEEIRAKYPDVKKIFFNQLTGKKPNEAKGRVIRINTVVESRRILDDHNKTTAPWFPIRKPSQAILDKLKLRDYFIFHARNLNTKCVDKNVTAQEFNFILSSISARFPLAKIVLVGKDDLPILGEIQTPNTIDLRGKIIMEELFYLIAWAKAFIAKDSGVAHLAGMAPAEMFCWGYVTQQWFPVTKNRAVFLTQKAMIEKHFPLFLNQLKSGE